MIEKEAISSANEHMSLEDARQVKWLHNNYRPLGELLDEGYLDKTRLEWAAQRAYEPKLQEAARVLLNEILQASNSKAIAKKDVSAPLIQSSETSVQVNISMEQAQTTPWPFPPFKGQLLMGQLSETKQISLKDLAFAVENAWNERVKKAATVLLLVRLKQVIKEPAPSAGFLHVETGGRSFAERQQYILTLLEGLLFGAIISACFVLFIITYINHPPQPDKAWAMMVANPSIGVGVAVMFLLLFGLAVLFLYSIGRLGDKLDKQIDNYRLGQEGEDRVAEVILQSLDGNWYLFRNVNLPGRNKGDLDAVLVGPSGVWVLEVKTFNGEYRNIGDQWEYRAGNRWKVVKTNPGRQANNNAIRLANFLKADNIKQWVTPVVVWANRESELKVENPGVAIWPIDRLPDELGNLLQDQSKSNPNQDIIVTKLSQLCKRLRDKV